MVHYSVAVLPLDLNALYLKLGALEVRAAEFEAAVAYYSDYMEMEEVALHFFARSVALSVDCKKVHDWVGVA